jgi:hypothetical protein
MTVLYRGLNGRPRRYRLLLESDMSDYYEKLNGKGNEGGQGMLDRVRGIEKWCFFSVRWYGSLLNERVFLLVRLRSLMPC